MINQLVNPYNADLTGTDVNIFQVNDANGRGYRAEGSDFVTDSQDSTESSSTTTTSSNSLEYD